MPLLAVIVPVYGAFPFARATVASAFACLPADTQVLIIDDASPIPTGFSWDTFLAEFPADRCHFHRYQTNAGLTRSWNHGLDQARDMGCEYIICANSDILFTPGCHRPLIHALQHVADLVGPVTNCAGYVSFRAQDVRRYMRSYEPSDSPEQLAAVADHLACQYGNAFRPVHAINGFCLAAGTETWFRYNPENRPVFDVRHPMTYQEEELQDRWRAAGARIGYCPGSLVFHYRSASRGPKYLQPGWFRPAEATAT